MTDDDEASSLGFDRTTADLGIEMAKRTRDEPAETRFDGVLGGSRGYGLPAVRTLSDEYRDVAEPEDSDRVPPPDPPGIVNRIVTRAEDLARRLRRTTTVDG